MQITIDVFEILNLYEECCTGICTLNVYFSRVVENQAEICFHTMIAKQAGTLVDAGWPVQKLDKQSAETGDCANVGRHILTLS